MRSISNLTAAGLALALVAAPAAAATFSAGVGPGTDNAVGSCSGTGLSSGASPISALAVCGDAIGVISGRANSSFGHLGARADAATFGGSSLPGQMGASAAFSDVLLFTSTNPAATFADVSANILLDGVLNASGGLPGGVGFARIDGFTQIGASGFEFRYDFDNVDGLTGFNHLGLVSGVIGPATDAVLSTPTVRVALNSPIFFSMSLETDAFSVRTAASARSDFGGSFRLPTGTDVFDPPAGVTVNAGDWLVNNRFHDPLATAGGAPEPTAWVLMLTGFGLAGAMLRRRSARVQA